MKTVSLYDGTVTIDFDEDKHVYTWREKNLPVRGVTTPLKILNKPALMPWAANMAAFYVRDNFKEGMTGAEMAALCDEARSAYRKKASEAADIGTAVHKLCEDCMLSLVSDAPAPVPPEDETAARSYAAFLSWVAGNEIEPLGVEQIIFSKEWYYAGTVDFYGRINGELCVLDFKTSSGIYDEMIIQVNAYARALEEMYGETIEAGWIVRLDKKTGKFQSKRFPINDEDKKVFGHILAIDDWQKARKEKK